MLLFLCVQQNPFQLPLSCPKINYSCSSTGKVCPPPFGTTKTSVFSKNSKEKNSDFPGSHWCFNVPLIFECMRPPWIKLWCYQTLTQTEIKHISSRHEAVKESRLQRVCRSRKFQSSLKEQFMWHCNALQKIFCPLTVWNFTPIHTNRWKLKFFNANRCKDQPLHKGKLFEKPSQRFLNQSRLCAVCNAHCAMCTISLNIKLYL